MSLNIPPLHLTHSAHRVNQLPPVVVHEDSLLEWQFITWSSEGWTHGLGEYGGELQQTKPVGRAAVLDDVGPDDVALLRGGLGNVSSTAGLLPALNTETQDRDQNQWRHHCDDSSLDKYELAE